MHICFLTNEYPRIGFPHGGIGSFVKTIAKELIKNDLQISIVGLNYLDKNEEYIEDGIEIFLIKKSNIKGISWFFNSFRVNKKLIEIHKKKPINIVESSELGLAFTNKILNVKYVIRLHGGHHFFAESENRKVNFWKGFQEKRSFKKADAFIAVSEFVKTQTQKYLSYHNKKVILLNYPIDTNFFKPIITNILQNKIIFAGTVCEKKGIRQLIQAFPKVKKQFPKATLDIYGRDWYFPNGNSYIEMLKKKELIKMSEIASSINFKGIVAYQEIPLKYAEGQVCVFPSHMETQGLVAPEAMAMEKMVIFTKLGPGPETIIDFETGLLCNPHSAQDIADKIIWVFENEEKVKKIQKKGREFVVNKYNLSKITHQNMKFYRSLV